MFIFVAECESAVQEFATAITSACKAFIYSTFYNGLSSSRSAKEKGAIADQLFIDYRAATVSNPEQNQLAWRSHVLVLKKTK